MAVWNFHRLTQCICVYAHEYIIYIYMYICICIYVFVSVGEYIYALLRTYKFMIVNYCKCIDLLKFLMKFLINYYIYTPLHTFICTCMHMHTSYVYGYASTSMI